MQLSAIRTAVKNRAGMDVNDAMVADTVLNEFVNGAIRQVAMNQDWDWNWAVETINTVDGTASYARAADCRKTDIVVDVPTGRALSQVNKTTGIRFSAGSREGIPRFWYVQGGNLVVVPTPNEVRALSHVYVSSEATLSVDTDAPAIPDWAIDIVIVKAAIMVTARIDNTSQQRLLQDEERDIMAGLADEARRSRGTGFTNSRRDWSL